jgi:hypothetical protein
LPAAKQFELRLNLLLKNATNASHDWNILFMPSGTVTITARFIRCCFLRVSLDVGY